MAEPVKHIVAKSVRATTQSKIGNREIIAEVCYYYPQYTLKEASELPVRDINLLLRVARKIDAKNKYDLVQIVSAPHTKKGKGVKQLTEHFKKEFE